MFTGLIEGVGEIAGLAPEGGGVRLRVRTGLAREVAAGDSVAVNGVCLTVVEAARDEIAADVSPETARVTTLGTLRTGMLVNLERPLPSDGRIGGHFVTGHVDATGTIEDIRPEESFRRVTLSFPPRLAPYVVSKGSIAVDGISLTVAELRKSRLEVEIVPFTWEHTNLKAARPGDRVNLEGDILGKYVVRATELAAGALKL